MAVFTDVASLIPALGERLGEGASLVEAAAVMVGMSDADVVAVLRQASQVSRLADQIRVVAAGVVADRSTRQTGHSGLAQSQGHRSPASFVQEVTGSTKGEASRDVRVGQALLDGQRDAGDAGAGAGAESGAGSGPEADAGPVPHAGAGADEGRMPESARAARAARMVGRRCRWFGMRR
ncbi:hypothetical protein [Microbacterium sp.]|uniref:hypothetical protein n=1 Tax=Microbacterium sp. TaxID=51671 RepID=UPI002810CC7E|nr:hypothetical protein [Microbacterium sp.]